MNEHLQEGFVHGEAGRRRALLHVWLFFIQNAFGQGPDFETPREVGIPKRAATAVSIFFSNIPIYPCT